MITFENNTDYRKPIVFDTQEAFLEFANAYISHPSQWGNRYSQQIDGIEIEWDGEWVAA